MNEITSKVEFDWSKQFYKALEAVGNLTEQERLKLGNMLIALSGVKSNLNFDNIPPPPEPPKNRQMHGIA